MIVSKICGGLAGQMLQYSTAKRISLKNNTELCLDLSWYKKNEGSPFIREFALHTLNTTYKVIAEKDFIWWKVKLCGKLNTGKLFNLQYVREKDYSTFDPTILELGDNLILDGYWNSYRYFEEIRDILIKEFVPKEEPDGLNRSSLEKIKKLNSVAVHFRRGDYKLTSFHGILSMDYYKEALNRVCCNISDAHLFIFSDDPQWVASNMQFAHPFDIIDFNGDDKNYWDMELMKSCKHNIIANSGFSWWSAWLNVNPDKMVVAPERWVNSSKGKIDNIPEGWILV
jgi:hypothetical protein